MGDSKLGSVVKWLERLACKAESKGSNFPEAVSICRDIEQVLHSQLLISLDVLIYRMVARTLELWKEGGVN